uniref:RING-type domain-containing protein n=1 Tax=Pyramimonas orientalis virus TaxID=455367 RepID=A0A7M3UP46_POV01|nr:hypothetical protein HWQ62_00372 [Pyramimonas orientalis virus]
MKQCDYENTILKKQCGKKSVFVVDGKRYCCMHIKHVNSDKEICCVCLDTINKKDWKMLHCKHHLHKECFGQLMSRYILTCPMCRGYMGRNIDLKEQFKIHINDQTFHYNKLEEIFQNDAIKEIRKRRRKDRPKYIFKRLIDVVIQEYIDSDNPPESELSHEFKNTIFLWVNAVTCKLELRPFQSTSFHFKYFPFTFKQKIYLQDADTINTILRSYLNTI